MTTPTGIDPAGRWLWASCVAALLIGMGIGWWHIPKVGPAPARTTNIPAAPAEPPATNPKP